MGTRYLTCAETAKLVRRSLKECFPGQKFSVRSSTYSMGASIDVSWLDGPSEEDVKSVVKRFEGATFDGMTDYKGGKEHELDGESVHMGADWVQTHRSFSDFAVKEAIAKAEEKWGPLDVEIHLYGDGTATITSNDFAALREAREALHKLSYVAKAREPSLEPKVVRTY